MAADYVEHRTLREWPTDGAALTDAVASLQAKGATFLRARFGDRHLVVEGWRERPTGSPASAAVKAGGCRGSNWP